jgi:hypothetical protein
MTSPAVSEMEISNRNYVKSRTCLHRPDHGTMPRGRRTLVRAAAARRENHRSSKARRWLVSRELRIPARHLVSAMRWGIETTFSTNSHSFITNTHVIILRHRPVIDPDAGLQSPSGLRVARQLLRADDHVTS